MPATLTRFTDDPMASDSAQFPLARPMATPDAQDEPSPQGVRPWGLLGMQPFPNRGTIITEWSYDHEAQVAVDAKGRPLNELRMDPTANKVTNNDGDEGPSEDFTYDFAPEQPFPA